jgi:hypothetical protein
MSKCEVDCQNYEQTPILLSVKGGNIQVLDYLHLHKYFWKLQKCHKS